MSRKIAYGGILLALNCIILLLVNIIPINTLFLLGLSSLPIAVVIMEYGPKAGILFYIGSVLLSFMLMANKSQWILYIFTFGIYGLVKYIIEKDRSFIQEYIMKLVAANILIIITYFIFDEKEVSKYLMKINYLIIRNIFPVISKVSGFVNISKDEIRKIFIKINNYPIIIIV